MLRPTIRSASLWIADTLADEQTIVEMPCGAEPVELRIYATRENPGFAEGRKVVHLQIETIDGEVDPPSLAQELLTAYLEEYDATVTESVRVSLEWAAESATYGITWANSLVASHGFFVDGPQTAVDGAAELLRRLPGIVASTLAEMRGTR